MSNLNLTLERAHAVVNQAEQLSLALIMLHNQALDPAQLHSLTHTLLEKLNSDLQYASMLILVNINQGGMGDAPMDSALSS